MSDNASNYEPASNPTGQRKIIHLREGAVVPGYTGYQPAFKFVIGKSLGTSSHHTYLKKLRSTAPVIFVKNSPDHEKTDLPNPDGGIRKYTKNMKTGYTGYIPTARFIYGVRYKESCDQAIKKHLQQTNTRTKSTSDLLESVKSSSRLRLRPADSSQQISSSVEGLTHQEPRRQLTEAPVVGYTGYVPLIKKSDCGIGVRYAAASSLGLKAFVNDVDWKQEISKTPVILHRNIGSRKLPLPIIKLYGTKGIHPSYTGFIPKKRYLPGVTHGQAVRAVYQSNSSSCIR